MPTSPGENRRRPRILVTGTLDRSDILMMLADVAREADLVFVEYFFNFGTPCHPDRFAPYGTLRFWHEFRDANALLDEVRPDRVVFFFITSLNQVALNTAARACKIPTLHLEHGFRQSFKVVTSYTWSEPRRLTARKLARETRVSVQNHLFFARSAVKAPKGTRRRLLRFARDAYTTDLSPHVLARHGALRRPDRYVAFSPETFEYHRVQDDLDTEQAKHVTFIGLPQFDRFAGLPSADVDPRKLVLVDSQIHKNNSFGWDLAYRHRWVKELRNLVRERGLHLFVKEHPGDDSRAWAPYLGEGDIELIDQERLIAVLPNVRTILGGFSTMQLPLIALPHTVFVALEIHPEPGFLPSLQFVEAGVAHVVRTFDELRDALDRTEQLHAAQAPHKATFVNRFLYKVDGGAAGRLRAALLDV